MSEAGAVPRRGSSPLWAAAGTSPESVCIRASEIEAEGWNPSGHRIGIIKSCLVTDDRERDWGKVRVAERRRMDIYHRFREEAGGHGGVQGIAEADRIPQTWVVGDVEHCVKELAAFIREYGLTDIVTGRCRLASTPDDTNASLERFARDVAPRLRAMFGGA